MKSIEKIYDVYLFKFYKENRKTDETINWNRWYGLDSCCDEIKKIM